MGVTAGDRILATAGRIPTAMFESPQAIIEAMIAAALNLRGQFPSACVMGMGMPGWCDYYRGTLYQLTNVRVWDHEVPVKELMEQALASCQQHWPQKAIYLGAQAHLQNFYQSFGFIPVTEVYEEDGIPHIGMAREVIQA